MKLYPNKKFTYDFPSEDATGKILDHDKRWTRLNDLIKENCGKPEVKTIVLDNLTDVAGYLASYIISTPAAGKGRPVIAKETIMEKTDWQPFLVLVIRMITNLKDFNKPRDQRLFANAPEKDDASPALWSAPKPLIGGQIKDILPTLFTDFWHTRVQNTGK